MASPLYPSHPRKKNRSLYLLTQGNKDAENIEIRKKFFDYFLKRLSKSKHFYKCTVTQEFLRNKNIDIEKVRKP